MLNQHEKTVLIVEDDIALNDAIYEALDFGQYNVIQSYSVEEAKKLLMQNTAHLIISDIHMKGQTGHELLKYVVENYSHIPIILMTAYGTIPDAVKAVQLGAQEYIVKPFEVEILTNLAAKYLKNSENKIICESESIKQLFIILKKLAMHDTSVLLEGESGVGKEVISRFIHDNSARSKQKFVAINCAAIPENMLEATLFGYEKGAFTGAIKSMPGKFELAQNGTLLLDEISEMDKLLQTKLLRVLQEKEVERIGSKETIKLNVRIIATTNKDLKKAVEAGTFREDLYYRLSVFPVKVPPLRERTEDILHLANYFINKHNKTKNKRQIELTDEAKELLLNYDWPGNIRELENSIQRALVLCKGMKIDDVDIMIVPTKHIQHEKNQLCDEVQSHEFQVILSALKKYKGSRTQVSKALGISPRTLRYKLAKLKKLNLGEHDYV